MRYDSALLIALVPVALTTYYCIGHLDIAVAEFVSRYLYASMGWRQVTSSIPDTLFILIVCVTSGSYSLFRYRASHYGIDAPAVMYKMLAAASPASYIIKSFLKYAFGRINTREWLHTPQAYGFHWFSGAEHHSGFPSGHMLVVTAMVAVVWRFHPRYRPACLVLLSVLALAMIATNYHFVSDVIAGVYVGLVVEACTCRVVGRKYRFLPMVNG
ncbi:MAG: phosphatase PAP2 family protein [Oryzomonas sp.]|uniref:phosphatase PAP2 family protein n=1 Tax=Oryzomonas sp. TaxID=2855186 RepID=UPI00283E7960|nr:phosphatase PAP2 family protein [Oryzomonas sp.]MDR3581153.1 phosphatase PAP2 family protein [Oryzomonas sp.]